MSNPRRKNRYRAKLARRAAALEHLAEHGPGIQGPATVEHHAMMLRLARTLNLPDTAVSHVMPHNHWTPPPLDNFTLRHAAAGASTIGDPAHRPPAPIDFGPPVSPGAPTP